MSIPPFHFSRDWTKPADYPTHQTSEAQNRADLQEALTEWEHYWNNTVLPALGSGGGSGGSSGNTDTTPYLPIAGGTMTGILRLAGSPQSSREAATKEYVDDATQSVMSGENGDISAIRQRVDEIETLVQNNQGDISTLTQRADQFVIDLQNATGEEALVQVLSDLIKLEVSRPTQGDGDKVFSSITLKIGPEEQYGEVLVDGNVDVSGELSADALYAAKGEIADLAVDRLKTSRRIPKYLARDQSDDNFVRVEGQRLEFVTATTNGSTEQARNQNAALLYWPMDVSGLPTGEDGYPLNSGERVFITTNATAYPVMVYTYTEAVKRSIRFELDSASGIYNVYDIFGAGNAAGLNKAIISKTANEWDFRYTTSGNKIIGLHMHNEGFVDIDGLRKTTKLDMSRFHEGYFSELVEGAAQAKEYRIAFNDSGVPVGITDEGGNTLQIVW